MRQHSNLAKDPAEKVVKDIRRATRKQYSAEEKIRIVLEGLRGEDSIAELCRREGIAQGTVRCEEGWRSARRQRWSKHARQRSATLCRCLRKDATRKGKEASATHLCAGDITSFPRRSPAHGGR